MSGVAARVLEIYGAPMETEDAARKMHQFLNENYGHAGRKFIEIILQDVKRIETLYAAYGKKYGSKLKSVHAANISFICFVDAIVSGSIFGQAEDDYIPSNIKMLELIDSQMQSGSYLDVNEKAVQYIHDWILSNKTQFVQLVKKGLEESPQNDGFKDPYTERSVTISAVDPSKSILLVRLYGLGQYMNLTAWANPQ